MASELINFPRESTMREIANALNMVAIAQAGGDNIESWAAVKQLVRQGLAPKAFPLGTQLEAAHSVYGTIVFDVVAHNVHKNPYDADAPTMTLLMHDCVNNRMFDIWEMSWGNTTGAALAAGTYNFTLKNAANNGGTGEDGAYQFTTTQPIPAGGGWRHSAFGQQRSTSSAYVPGNIIGGTIKTYDASGSAVESGLVVTSGSEGISLGAASLNSSDTINTVGKFNSTQRSAYGSGNWKESSLRQWLNSDAAANAWWVAQTPFDLKPSYASAAGFLNGLDASFLSAVGEVDIATAYNTVYETGGVLTGSYTTRERFFLPSMQEIGLGTNNGVAEGALFGLYNGAKNADRVKYDISAPTTVRNWWLRSPSAWVTYCARYVGASGMVYDSGVGYGAGAAAACVIY